MNKINVFLLILILLILIFISFNFKSFDNFTTQTPYTTLYPNTLTIEKKNVDSSFSDVTEYILGTGANAETKKEKLFTNDSREFYVNSNIGNFIKFKIRFNNLIYVDKINIKLWYNTEVDSITVSSFNDNNEEITHTVSALSTSTYNKECVSNINSVTRSFHISFTNIRRGAHTIYGFRYINIEGYEIEEEEEEPQTTTTTTTPAPTPTTTTTTATTPEVTEAMRCAKQLESDTVDVSHECYRKRDGYACKTPGEYCRGGTRDCPVCMPLDLKESLNLKKPNNSLCKKANIHNNQKYKKWVNNYTDRLDSDLRCPLTDDDDCSSEDFRERCPATCYACSESDYNSYFVKIDPYTGN